MPGWGQYSGVIVRLEIAEISPLLVGFTFTPSSRQIKDLLFKNSDKFRWNRDYGRWGLFTFPYSQKSQRIVDLKNIIQSGTGKSVKIKDLDPRITGELRKEKCSRPEVDWNHIPKSIEEILYPFQREGVEYAIQRDGKALIADDMGLGKTIQAIAVSSYYKPDWPVLVVCPSSVRLNWRAEFCKWMGEHIHEDEVNVILKGSQKIRIHKNEKHLKVVVISYGLIAKKIEEIKAIDFKIIICDESHYIKTATAQRTKALVPLLKKTKRVLLLTGTPAMSRPIELHTQVEALKPGLLGKKAAYGERYCGAQQRQYGYRTVMEYKGAHCLRELHLLLKEHCMIRRLKANVLKDLPPKTRTAVMTEVKSKKLEQMKMKIDDMRSAINGMEGGGGPNNEQRQMLIKMYQETGRAKVPATKEFITELIEADKKFLVFAHHQCVLDELEKHVKSKKVRYFRIDGAVKAEDRQRGVEEFQREGSDMRVAILSIMAAGQGLTLTAADLIVFAELQWTPANLIQAEDRVHRIGQVNHTTIYYIVAKGSLDDQMWPLISQKMRVLGASLDGQQSSMRWDREVRNFQDDKSSSSSFGSQQKRKREEIQTEGSVRKKPKLNEPAIKKPLSGIGIDTLVSMGYDKNQVHKAAKIVFERKGTDPSDADRFVRQALDVLLEENFPSSEDDDPYGDLESLAETPPHVSNGSKQNPVDLDSSDDDFLLDPPPRESPKRLDSPEPPPRPKKRPKFGSGLRGAARKPSLIFGNSSVFSQPKPQIEDTIPCEICNRNFPFSEFLEHQQNCLHASQDSELSV